MEKEKTQKGFSGPFQILEALSYWEMHCPGWLQRCESRMTNGKWKGHHWNITHLINSQRAASGNNGLSAGAVCTEAV